MNVIILPAHVGEDRKLVVQLPENAPTGSVEVTVRPAPEAAPEGSLTFEAARARLRAAGALSLANQLPDDAQPLTLEERIRLGTMPPNARPTEELIDEDRGPY